MFCNLLLKAKIKDVGEWKAVINAIADIAEEAMFICNDDGITFRGMDAAHVALLDVTFPLTAFDLFESKATFFGIRIADFQNVLRSANDTDKVEFTINDDENFLITIDGQYKSQYNLRLIERSEVNTPIPKVDYKSKVSIGADTLGRILNNVHPISEYVTIECSTDKVRFLSNGDVGSATIDVEKGNPDLVMLSTIENSKSVYSLDYIAKVVKAIGRASKKLDFEYATQLPIHLQFEMPTKTRVEYYLAPKIE